MPIFIIIIITNENLHRVVKCDIGINSVNRKRLQYSIDTLIVLE